MYNSGLVSKEQQMRGKYSPTVTAAYGQDKKWFTKYAATKQVTNKDFWSEYDPEGYDAYGYDENEVDRAGNQEHVYYCNDLAADGLDGDCNYLFEDLEGEWGFDGTKPVKR
jgi:hypothetical protein